MPDDLPLGVSHRRSNCPRHRAARRRWRMEPLEARLLLSATAVEWDTDAAAGDSLLPCTCGCCRPVGDALVYEALSWQEIDGSSASELLPDSLFAEVLPAIESDGAEGGSGGEPQAAGLPLSSVPALSSLPGAFAKLYLDFVGDTTSNWGSYHPGTTPAYDTDGDATTFSTTELANINEIWSRVAEKYSPFQVNVTTVDPGNINNLETVRVVIGGNGSWYGSTAGGVAYVGSFSNSHPTTGKNIVFVFSQNLGGGNPRYVAEAAAHEAGHSFGLEHQSVWNGSTKVSEYNTGDSLRAPVMGASYNAARGLWWLGRNALPGGPTQDDMAVVSGATNNFGYRADDHGNSVGAATPLSPSGANVYGSGIITTTGDVDYFSFTTTPGTVRFTVSPASFGATLDATLELRDAVGTLLVSADTASLGESLVRSVAAGSYRVVVKSHGSYGDVGQYSLVGVLPDAYEDNDSRLTAADIGVGTGMQLNNVNIDQSGDDDWYRFLLLAPDTVDIAATFSHGSGNLDLEVADVNGTVLASSTSSTDNELVQLGNLTAGLYYIRVYGVAGATNNYSLGVLPGSLPLDLVAPQVAAVTLVGGGSLQAQYAVPAGSGEQLRVVPLGLVDQIRITFSEDVAIDEADLLVTGSQVPVYAFDSFTYESLSRTATWRLEQPIDADVVALQLNADGSSPITDLVGNRLDGEWENPVGLDDPSSSVFPSGNGTAGGNFYFLATILPGDANRNNAVDAGDYTLWADHYLEAGGWAQGDFNDDGLVDAGDYTIWADHFLIVPSSAAIPPEESGVAVSNAEIPSAEAPAAAAAAVWLSSGMAPAVAMADAADAAHTAATAPADSVQPSQLESLGLRVSSQSAERFVGGPAARASVTWLTFDAIENVSVERGTAIAPGQFVPMAGSPAEQARLAAVDRLFAADGRSTGRSSQSLWRSIAPVAKHLRGALRAAPSIRWADLCGRAVTPDAFLSLDEEA